MMCAFAFNLTYNADGEGSHRRHNNIMSRSIHRRIDIVNDPCATIPMSEISEMVLSIDFRDI